MVRFKLWHHILTMLESQFTVLAKVIYSFKEMATVITIVNYNHTVIMIINYNPKTFIVQATDFALIVPLTSSHF